VHEIIVPLENEPKCIMLRLKVLWSLSYLKERTVL